MQPIDFLRAARVPETLRPQAFGPWTIERKLYADDDPVRFVAGVQAHTILWRSSLRTLHREGPGEVVMEDSNPELRKHLPIWLAARGRVLVTGLGLGCVVRGLLAKSEVEHVDVVEIDGQILRVVGAEFADDPRVALHHGDALKVIFQNPGWDYAWHDLWTDGDRHLQCLHADLLARYRNHVPLERQGCWAWPRIAKRRATIRLLGTPRIRRAA